MFCSYYFYLNVSHLNRICMVAQRHWPLGIVTNGSTLQHLPYIYTKRTERNLNLIIVIWLIGSIDMPRIEWNHHFLISLWGKSLLNLWYQAIITFTLKIILCEQCTLYIHHYQWVGTRKNSNVRVLWVVRQGDKLAIWRHCKFTKSRF